jgi:hypothetical protein
VLHERAPQCLGIVPVAEDVPIRAVDGLLELRVVLDGDQIRVHGAHPLEQAAVVPGIEGVERVAAQ